MKKKFRIYYEESIEFLFETNDYYSGRDFYPDNKTLLSPYNFHEFSSLEEAETWIFDNVEKQKEQQSLTILPIYIIPKR